MAHKVTAVREVWWVWGAAGEDGAPITEVATQDEALELLKAGPSYDETSMWRNCSAYPVILLWWDGAREDGKCSKHIIGPSGYVKAGDRIRRYMRKLEARKLRSLRESWSKSPMNGWYPKQYDAALADKETLVMGATSKKTLGDYLKELH